MSAQHTLGPWEIDPETRPAEVCTVHGLPPHKNGGQTWAHIRGALGYWGADENENLANARLISAAPDFYEACKALIQYCDRNPPMGDSLWSVQQIRRAIKKAEGGAA